MSVEVSPFLGRDETLNEASTRIFVCDFDNIECSNINNSSFFCEFLKSDIKLRLSECETMNLKWLFIF